MSSTESIKDLLHSADEIEEHARKEIKPDITSETREQLRLSFFGRAQGSITNLTKKLGALEVEDRKVLGMRLNKLKALVDGLLNSTAGGAEQSSHIDTTLTGKEPEVGHLHPLTQFMRKVTGVFTAMGFEIVEGSEVETEEYNFDLLNVPATHPARDTQDTFWLKNGLLLRTHTSPMQVRAMKSRKPPVRLIVPGRVFRHEATDAGHETTFMQCEGLVIDSHVRVTDLIGTIRTLLQSIFGDVKIRMRPHFYPFVEPGLDVDMSCLICGGKGCSVCKQTGWLEMMGSGMVHPKVLKNMNIDPKKYTGFAFGLGIDRFMMLYYGVNDIRLSWSGDLRFLKQF